MPGFTITRGLGGSATSMLSIGFIGETLRRIVKGGKRFVDQTIVDIEEKLKISVMLISANGKELSKPIFNNVSKIFRSIDDITIRVKPKTLIQKRSKKIKVTAKLRNEKHE